jgi:anaerobic dimethyl sulfoxide reductase subunit C (anchor subunit)
MPSSSAKLNQKVHPSEEVGSLAMFTTLAPLAVGGLFGLAIVGTKNSGPGLGTAAIYILIIGILALLTSLFHLGRPWRAPLAVLHLATSWLSREVLFFGLFLLLTFACVLKPLQNLNGVVFAITLWAAVLAGLAATIATGQTYRLTARPSWDSWLTTITFPLSALSVGSLFGFFLADRFTHNADIAGYVWILPAILLLFSLAVTWLRLTIPHPGTVEAQLSKQLLSRSYLWMLFLRIFAVLIALGLILLGSGLQFLAWIPALIAEFIDRWLFFMTVVPVSLRTRYT